MVATIARGSSDHATAFLKYAIELTAGLPVASIGPSIVSIYGRELKLRRCAVLAVSQSGKSPDIVAMEQSARRILEAKARLGLHRTKTISLDNVPLTVGGRKHDAVARAIVVVPEPDTLSLVIVSSALALLARGRVDLPGGSGRHDRGRPPDRLTPA